MLTAQTATPARQGVTTAGEVVAKTKKVDAKTVVSEAMLETLQATIDAVQARTDDDSPVSWTKSWEDDPSTATGMPHNGASGYAYSSGNAVFLFFKAAMLYGGESRWYTMRQANAAKGRVRKGEKSTPVLGWILKHVCKDTGERLNPKNPQHKAVIKSGGSERKPVACRVVRVFNHRQINWSDDSKHAANQHQLQQEPNGSCPVVTRAVDKGLTLQHGGNSAHYAPMRDLIQMPAFEQFNDEDAYYGTLYHEITHWTGHPSRLDRPLEGRYNLEQYAHEELVAEFGSVLLCAYTGRRCDVQHVDYLRGWLDAAKQEPRVLLDAASSAQKAVKFLLA